MSIDTKNDMNSLIIDTDLGNDIDDALALALAHCLSDNGECKFIGVAVNKANEYSPAMVDVLNTFYGRGDMPIGMVSDGKTSDDGKFLKTIVESKVAGQYKYARTYDSYKTDAVKMYRKLLAEADDASVSIVSIGFMTNLAKLLVSSGDEYSQLNGSELVAKKVRLLSAMAGNFTQQALSSQNIKYAEYNIKFDIKSAQYVCDNWPTDVLFSGLEVGSGIMYPSEAIYNDYSWIENHPVVEAYNLYLEMPYDRQTWDLTSVLCAVRNSLEYFDLSENGQVAVDDRGVNSFNARNDGKHRYLILRKGEASLVQNLMRGLCSYKPEAAKSKPALVK